MKREVCTPIGGPGVVPPEQAPSPLAGNYQEVVLGFDAKAAKQAASRCLGAHFCTFCEVCQLLCPDQCITRHPETGEILIDLNYCKGCGLCAFYCPKGAIRMEQEQAG